MYHVIYEQFKSGVRRYLMHREECYAHMTAHTATRIMAAIKLDKNAADMCFVRFIVNPSMQDGNIVLSTNEHVLSVYGDGAQ